MLAFVYQLFPVRREIKLTDSLECAGRNHADLHDRRGKLPRSLQ